MSALGGNALVGACVCWVGLGVLACSDPPSAGGDAPLGDASPTEGAGRSDGGGDGSPDSGAGRSDGGGFRDRDGSAPGGDRDGSTATSNDGSAPDAGDAESCVEATQVARRAGVDMYIMLDRSASMQEVTAAGGVKWDAIRAAITAFIAEPTSVGMGVGLQYFPLGTPGVPEQCVTDAECGASGGSCLNRACVPGSGGTPQITWCISSADCPAGSLGCMPLGTCSLDASLACFNPGPGGCDTMGDCDAFVGECTMFASCVPEDYAMPAVELAPLPDNATALTDSLNATTPIGLTPTRPALEGAIEYARTHAAQNPTRHVIVVLATDGLPTTCGAADTGLDEAVAEVAQVAAGGLAGSPAVETSVIGVFSPTETSAMQNLETIAAAGGTEPPLLVDPAQDVSTQFRSALDAIRMGARSCRFELPEAPSGRTLDLDTVALVLRSSDAEQALTRVDDQDGCDAGTLGWLLADAATSTAPVAVQLCTSACDALQAADDGEIAMRIGCEP